MIRRRGYFWSIDGATEGNEQPSSNAELVNLQWRNEDGEVWWQLCLTIWHRHFIIGAFNSMAPWFNLVMTALNLMARVFDSRVTVFDSIVGEFNSKGMWFNGCSIQFNVTYIWLYDGCVRYVGMFKSITAVLDLISVPFDMSVCVFNTRGIKLHGYRMQWPRHPIWWVDGRKVGLVPLPGCSIATF